MFAVPPAVFAFASVATLVVLPDGDVQRFWFWSIRQFYMYWILLYAGYSFLRQKDEAERARFDDLHPDCLTQHTGDVKDDQPYGYPWRYDENGDPNEYYALLKEKFGYPNPTDTLY